MDSHWQNKKQLSKRISYGEVDSLYDSVKREYGVTGGKIIGAGGGGFIMLYCPKKRKELTEFMARKGYPRLHYNLEFQGTQVLTNTQVAHARDEGGK